MKSQDFVIITPARNEEENIGRTIESMLAQRRRPLRWVIVNDGSTDRTGEIIQSFAERHPFIEHVGVGGSGKANFGSKVAAFNAGYARLAGLDYAFIGNLDADVSFAPDYFERLLDLMEREPRLGLAGGIIMELIGSRFVPQTISDNSVAGAVIVFRRECYEQVGGYVPLKMGGEDSAAEITARMHGWETRTIRELEVRHHGRVTNGRRSLLQTRFCKGMTNYLLGYHPLFQLSVSAFRLRDRPLVMGGIMMELGYVWAAVARRRPALAPEIVRYLRQEQLQRLRGLLTRGRAGETYTGIPSGGK